MIQTVRYSQLFKVFTLLLALAWASASAQAQSKNGGWKPENQRSARHVDNAGLPALDFKILSVHRRQVKQGSIVHFDARKNDNAAIDIAFSAKQAEGTQLEEFLVTANLKLNNSSTIKKQMKVAGTARSASFLFTIPDESIAGGVVEVTAFCRNLKNGKVYSSIVQSAGYFSASGELVER